MSVTLDQILMLAGRLDGAPGYDAPRERFRRFLLDYVREWPVARALLEQCQYSPDEEHRLALDDLVALLGQFLGLRVTFAPASWHARGRATVLLDVKSSPSAPADVEVLRRAIGAAARAGDASVARHAGLCVLSPLYLYRVRLEEAAAGAGVPIGVVALRSLVVLADFVHAGRLDRQDVMRLLESNISIDFMVDLMAQSGTLATPAAAADVPGVPIEADTPAPEAPLAAADQIPAGAIEPAGAARDDDDDAQCWLAPVAPDYATNPEEFLERVVAKRLTFGVADAPPSGREVRPGDRLCFYVSGRGVVGHARVASLAGGAAGLRDAHRFRQILQLQALELFLSSPAAIDAETQLRLRTAQVTPGHKQTLVRISRESFVSMTAPPESPQRAWGR